MHSKTLSLKKYKEIYNIFSAKRSSQIYKYFIMVPFSEKQQEIFKSFCSKMLQKPDMVVHCCNPNNQEAEAELLNI